MNEMRKIIIDRIMDDIESREGLTVDDWNMMLDFDLGIINADKDKVSELPEKVARQVKEWLQDCDDFKVMEVFDYFVMDCGE